MNTIWTYMMLISVVALIFTDPEIIITEMTNTSLEVLQLCVELMAIYTIWMGLLEIVDASGLGKKLAKLLSPLIRWLFKVKDSETTKYIALNMSSNMLGLGNASTPMGIKAMQKLDPKTGAITPAMIMLLIINSTAIQFLPTTVIGLRASSGSLSPSDILIPTILATMATCVFGILMAKLCEKIFFKNKPSSQSGGENISFKNYIQKPISNTKQNKK